MDRYNSSRDHMSLDGLTHLFGITRGSVSTNIGKMSPIIRDSLPLPQKLHKQACEATTIEDLRELFPGMVSLVDASEQPYGSRNSPRPGRRSSRARPGCTPSRSSTRPASTG